MVGSPQVREIEILIGWVWVHVACTFGHLQMCAKSPCETCELGSNTYQRTGHTTPFTRKGTLIARRSFVVVRNNCNGMPMQQKVAVPKIGDSSYTHLPRWSAPPRA